MEANIFPFNVHESEHPGPDAVALFRRAFGADLPTEPCHFVASMSIGGRDKAVGYVHFISFAPMVYLCGGLCIDSAVYRQLSEPQRRAVAACGSLSRWLLEASIAGLGPKEAVFAYTGDVRTRRDVIALGFAIVKEPYLLVQWHGPPSSHRVELVERVGAHGPF